MRGHLKFNYEAMNWTATNWIALNWTMWSQIKACIAKSRESCALPRHYTALSGNSALTFRDNLLVPASRVTKFKRENRAWGKLTDTIFFLGLYPSSNFLKTCNVLEAGSPFSGKEAPNLVDPLDWVFLNHWAPQKQ